MGTITDRISSYLLNRLRRQAINEVYSMAEEAGLLESRFIVEGEENSGVVWRVTAKARELMTAAPNRNRVIVARHLRAHGCNVDLVAPTDKIDPHTVRSVRAKTDRAGEGQSVAPRDSQHLAEHGMIAGDNDFLRLIREFAPRPVVADAALALLLARAIGESVSRLDRLLAVLRQSNPFIVVKIPLPRFERHLDRQLERGKILPIKLNTIEGFTSFLPEGTLRSSRRHKFTVATFSGTEIAEKSASFISKSLTLAAMSPRLPTVIIDETDAELHPMAAGADLVIRGSGIDDAVLIELMDLCCGVPPSDAWGVLTSSAVNLVNIGLDDLTLALRAGRTVPKMLAVLETLSEMRLEEKQDEEDKAGETKSKPKSGGNKKAAGPSFERIEPAAASMGEGTVVSDVAVLRVETLSGYGLAKDWALDLRTDLPLWSKGDVAWSEMSTRLLLSGPPGTGKTTFARALCNTLQLPLLATSVGRWLESSYLGDVLSSMAGTFEAAKAAAPCVLFIDEADNIGRRSRSSRDFGDYWDSIVNRMLELLDGASKTDGVIIVAATNSPEKIDPALLRSGRLERHIVIPQPDREALTGILRHHLGSDVSTVLATRPATSAGTTGENAAWAKITPAKITGIKPINSKQQGPQA